MHRIFVQGEAERPICHFELPFVNSENQERIVEIKSLGYNNRNIKRFYVLNPTALSYTFQWMFDHKMNSYLKCLTPKGTILSGKKFEMQFEFSPTKNCPDKIEKLFKFQIPQHKVQHNFMFKTVILQPKIFFSRAKIDFGPLLLSGKGKEVVYIKNLDEIPYHFHFQRQSIKGNSQSHYNSLQVSPISGAIAPQSEVPISITFLPKIETSFNYNLLCNITSKKEALALNIKGIGYKLHHQVVLGKRIISSHFNHELNFGDIFVNGHKKQSITLVNDGDFNFDFVISGKRNQALIIEPETGTVHKREKLTINFLFEPKFETVLNNKVQLQIISGPKYKLQLKGIAKLPQIHVKPSIINFGSVLVTSNPFVIQKQIKFINHDQKTLTIDSDFEKNDHLNIKMAASQSILPYNNNKDNILKVPVLLNLRKLGKFSENLEFIVNGNHKLIVTVKGEGVSLALELEKPQNINLDMGELRVGLQTLKEVKILNNSKVPIGLIFDNPEQLKALSEMHVSLNPKNLYIPQKSSGTLHLQFAPLVRLRNFQIPLTYKLKESSETFELLQIKGACYGVELKLMNDQLEFHNVVLNSSLTKDFNLINLGDINAEFEWDLGFMEEYFTILPKRGIVSSNQRITFEATFRPKSLNDYKLVAKMKIRGSNQALKLTLQGCGISTPQENITDINFECAVREIESRQIEVKNPTDATWNIQPTIKCNNVLGTYFTSEPCLTIPAKGSQKLQISFKPLYLNPGLQTGSLFLPLQNGNAIMYNLIGNAKEPNPEEIKEISLEAKKRSNYTLNVKNWLNLNQRLESEFQLLDGEDPISQGLIITAAERIDLGAQSFQNFKITFYSLLSGNFEVRATFRNIETQEYIFYILKLKVEQNEVQKEIQLNTCVRESVPKVILLENPLPESVIISQDQIKMDSNHVFIQSKLPLTLKPNFDFGLKINYRPLTELKDEIVPLTINSEKLGVFKYNLVLNSVKSNNIPTLMFKGKIGDSSTKSFQFMNFLQKPSTYTVKIENLETIDPKMKLQTDFSPLQSTIQVPACVDYIGTQQNIEIKYEPSVLGGSKSLMSVTSSEGGVYQAYLIGNSTMPLPKGPFKVGSKGFNIEFKNPFFKAKEFEVRTTNPVFVCGSKPNVKLEAKKNLNIKITFKPGNETNFNGRLVVSCSENIQWVFYLQGVK